MATENTHGMTWRTAELGLTGWHGITWTPCLIVGETPKRYRIKSADGSALRLAGPRSIGGDETALVPKRAVRTAIAVAICAVYGVVMLWAGWRPEWWRWRKG